jgi:hypothetical protein
MTQFWFGKAADAPPTTAAWRPAATRPIARQPAAGGLLVARPRGAPKNQRCCSGSRWRAYRRCPVIPRRRTDLALLLIIRRAERDAGMLDRSRREKPDNPTGIGPGRGRDEPESPRAS